jgi:hypothetical protein
MSADNKEARFREAAIDCVTRVLDEARAAVYGARRESYGTPYTNHSRTAVMWSAYLDGKKVLTPRDVCMLNILQKVSRDRYRETHDNVVDIAGYAENAALCDEDDVCMGCGMTHCVCGDPTLEGAK